MDRSRPVADPFSQAAVAAAPRAPALAVVSARFRLSRPAAAAPDAWQSAARALLAWLRIEAEFVPEPPARRLPRIAEWSGSGQAAAPVFAPWLGWSPAAFQFGGLSGLPQAQFAASYCIDHPRGGGLGQGGGADIVLMSPHPVLCMPEDTAGVPVPRAEVLRAMIAAARNEQREKLAIVVSARQRNAIARLLLAADRGLTREGLTLDILTIEEALPPLIAGGRPWDAIIAMPDLRGTVFTLLAETTGVRGAWPMLWHGRDGLRTITSEAPGDGMSRLPLDAPALIHALALALQAAGIDRPARRLHEGWARLRDSGVTTAGRDDAAPYVNAVADGEFIAMLCAGKAASQRPQSPWRALGAEENAPAGSQVLSLRVVS
jgi:hypothetical protein